MGSSAALGTSEGTFAARTAASGPRAVEGALGRQEAPPRPRMPCTQGARGCLRARCRGRGRAQGGHSLATHAPWRSSLLAVVCCQEYPAARAAHSLRLIDQGDLLLKMGAVVAEAAQGVVAHHEDAWWHVAGGLLAPPRPDGDPVVAPRHSYFLSAHEAVHVLALQYCTVTVPQLTFLVNQLYFTKPVIRFPGVQYSRPARAN